MKEREKKTEGKEASAFWRRPRARRHGAGRRIDRDEVPDCFPEEIFPSLSEAGFEEKESLWSCLLPVTPWFAPFSVRHADGPWSAAKRLLPRRENAVCAGRDCSV